MASSNLSRERRILALWLPPLPTDRIRRRNDSAVSAEREKRSTLFHDCVQPDLPLVITAKIDNALRLVAVDEKAAHLSLKPGMPLANARAMVPALCAVEADGTAERKLLDRIADWCDRFTPFVASDPPHGLLLDVTGVTH